MAQRIRIRLKAFDHVVLDQGAPVETSAAVAARVAAARAVQGRRGATNVVLESEALAAACALGTREHQLLDAASRRLGLSARACHRILRVARTIADLGGIEQVGVAELSEAIGYRRLDRAQLPAAAM